MINFERDCFATSVWKKKFFCMRIQGREPRPIASKLRLDHGAIASLLMPPPTVSIIATIRAVLKVHNTIEEGPVGLYEACDEQAGSESAQLLAKLQAAPELAAYRQLPIRAHETALEASPTVG